MPKTKRAPLSLSLLLSLAADADNDRPDDAWESANVLTPVRTTVLIYIDATGLPTSKLYADGHGPSYTYTADGKLATRTWARKDAQGNDLVTTYTYNLFGEMTGIDYSDSTPDVTYSYTRLGKLSQVTDAVGTRTFAYNSTFDEISETITGLYSKTLTRTYTSTGFKGKKQGLSIDNVSHYTYGYDIYGRMNQVTIPSGSFNYTRMANSDLVSQMTRPNGITTTWSYETNRDLITQVQNGAVSTYGYVNDAIGRRTSMSRSGSAYATSDVISYTYNDRSELTGAQSSVDTTYSYSYAYDPIGNRITANEAGVPWTYTTNSLNQYTSATENNTQLSFAYDLDGSMTYRPVDATSGWTQVWNSENRMVETYKGSDRLTFKYDYMGRRVEKSVFSNNTLASKTLFVYDGFKCVEELDALNNNAVAMRHTWQSIDVGLDVILSTTDGNGTTCFLHDANKNVMQRIDELNGLEDCLTYSPFGVNVNNCQLHFGFSCEVTESFICLDYFNYRYYAPNIGRWIRPDPFTEKGFSLFTQSDIFDNISFFDDNNLLIYAQNNGIMEYDNIGLACGSTYSDILIPDKPSGFDFTQPCIIHDDCYGCKGKNEGKEKLDCDKQFLRDMQAVCNTHPESKKAWCTRHRGRRVIRYRCTKHPRKECKNLAAIYHWAVATLGKRAYDNARKCCP